MKIKQPLNILSRGVFLGGSIEDTLYPPSQLPQFLTAAHEAKKGTWWGRRKGKAIETYIYDAERWVLSDTPIDRPYFPMGRPVGSKRVKRLSVPVDLIETVQKIIEGSQE